jgi:acetoin utilization deacetylase AcuC-like enzyme
LNPVSESKALTNADLPNSLGRQNTQSSYGFLQQFSMRNVFEFMISCSLLVQVGGTVLSAKLAKDKGWAINLGGGFHHCCSNEGGGFCAYADITLTIQFAFARLGISRHDI